MMLLGQSDEINIEEYFELQKPNRTQVLLFSLKQKYTCTCGERVGRGEGGVEERLTLVIFFENNSSGISMYNSISLTGNQLSFSFLS